MSHFHYLKCTDENCEQVACVDRRYFGYRIAEKDREIERLKADVVVLNSDGATLRQHNSAYHGQQLVLVKERDQLRAELAAMRVAIRQAAVETNTIWKGESGSKIVGEAVDYLVAARKALSLPAAKAAHERMQKLRAVAEAARETFGNGSGPIADALRALDATEEKSDA